MRRLVRPTAGLNVSATAGRTSHASPGPGESVGLASTYPPSRRPMSLTSTSGRCTSIISRSSRFSDRATAFTLAPAGVSTNDVSVAESPYRRS